MKDVPKVAEYLFENGYYHKFLHGGEVQDGKVFTIYFGSRKMVDVWSSSISEDLRGKLVRPVDSKEIELAQGIVGRFAVRDRDHVSEQKYTPYGQCGIPLLRSKATGQDMYRYLQHPSEIELREVFDVLSKDFGSYFTG